MNIVNVAHVNTQFVYDNHLCKQLIFQTSQELPMLSSVTINCKITKIVMNSGSQLSEL